MAVLCEQSGSVTLGVRGKVCKDALPAIGRFIAAEQKHKRVVLLDLSEVTLLDPAAARFFREKISHGAELVNCPGYIKNWISPNEPED